MNVRKVENLLHILTYKESMTSAMLSKYSVPTLRSMQRMGLVESFTYSCGGRSRITWYSLTMYGRRHAKWLSQFPDETLWNSPGFPTNPTSG